MTIPKSGTIVFLGGAVLAFCLGLRVGLARAEADRRAALHLLAECEATP